MADTTGDAPMGLPYCPNCGKYHDHSTASCMGVDAPTTDADPEPTDALMEEIAALERVVKGLDGGGFFKDRDTLRSLLARLRSMGEPDGERLRVDPGMLAFLRATQNRVGPDGVTMTVATPTDEPEERR